MKQKETSPTRDRAAPASGAPAPDAGAEQAAAETEAGGERERISSLISAVGLALVRGDTLRETLGRCAEALVEHLDAAFARVWTLDEAAGVLELQASAGLYTHLDGEHARVPVGRFKIGVIAKERRPHLTNSVVGDPRVGDQEWARREGMVSFAGYPLVVGDRLVGVMALFARHALTDASLQAMEAVANGVALGIERKAAEEALKESQALNQSVLDSLTAHIAVLDRAGTIVAVNDAWRRFAAENAGAGPTTAVGASYLGACESAVGAEDLTARMVLHGIRAVLEGARDNFTFEYPCHAPGEERWFLLNVTPLRRESGGAVVAHTDITARKRAEEALASFSREREQMLQEVSTPLVPVLEGVLVMPLIGSLDTARMQRATQAALAEVRRTGARACVIDITGARITDSHAVSNLTNLVQSLRLVGAQGVVTGVGAQAAQSMVGLGLDFQGVRTHRTLAQALAALNRSD